MALIGACAISLNGCLGVKTDQYVSLLEHTEDRRADLIYLQRLRSQMTGVIMGHNTYKAFPRVHPVDHDQPLTHVILTRSGQVNRESPLFQQDRHPVMVASDRPLNDRDLYYHDIPHLMAQLPAGDWLVEGGGHIVQSFLPYLNEVHLTICPVWLEGGIPLFHQGWLDANAWRVAEVTPLTHAVAIRYVLNPS